MKDFNHCFRIDVTFHQWMWDFMNDGEDQKPTTDSTDLWFALFCFEAKNQGE